MSAAVASGRLRLVPWHVLREPAWVGRRVMITLPSGVCAAGAISDVRPVWRLMPTGKRVLVALHVWLGGVLIAARPGCTVVVEETTPGTDGGGS